MKSHKSKRGRAAIVVIVISVAAMCLLLMYVLNDGPTSIPDHGVRPASTEPVSTSNQLSGPQPGESRASIPYGEAAPLSASVSNSSFVPFVHVQVIDQATSEPCRGALIENYDYQSGTQTVLHCDDTGQLDFPWGGLRQLSLAISAPGYSSLKRSVITRSQRSIIVALPKAVTISGVVTFHGGQPAEAGIRVLALDSSMYLNDRKEIVRRLSEYEGRPSITDESGRFTISGIRPDATYTVVAGGRGLVSSTPLQSVPAGSKDLEIIVSRLHCILVDLVDGDDNPIRTSNRLWAPREVSADGSLRAEAKECSSGFAVLAGVPVSIAVAQGPRSIRLFYVSESDRETLGTVMLTFRIPGFERTNASIATSPVHDPKALTISKLRLQKSTDEFGSVLINIHSTLPRLQVRSVMPALFITLSSPTMANSTQIYLQDYSDQMPIQVDGIPTGPYSCMLTNGGGTPLCPNNAEVSIEVRSNSEPAVIEFDLMGLASVTCTPVLDGEEYAGAATIEAYRQEGGQRIRVSSVFLGPPYALIGLIPAEYEITILRHVRTKDMGTMLGKSDPKTCRLSPGENVQMEIELRSR